MSTMAMSMSMSSATASTMNMPMASNTMASSMPTSASSSSADPMDMMMSGMMDMSQMYMVFFTSTTTSLFTMDWTPKTTGQYAGTCIFLILLSTILRILFAFKAVLERRWMLQSLKRTHAKIVTEATSSETGGLPPRPGAITTTTAILKVDGTEEKVRIVEKDSLALRSVRPWRLSVDLPRAGLVTAMVTVGYLLMLAVMTMNVGYFLSVLAGAFVGELFFGRYSAHTDEHH